MPNEVTPIPPGFHSLTIHLSVQGAAEYMDFLKRAFGAEELQRSASPGGKLLHARVRIGDSILMFADDFTEEFRLPPLVRGNLPFVINLYVADANATFEKAVAAGCQVRMPLADQFWGDRYGHLADPFGFTWAIAQRIEELTPEQMHARSAKMFGGGH